MLPLTVSYSESYQSIRAVIPYSLPFHSLNLNYQLLMPKLTLVFQTASPQLIASSFSII